jgi:hypothetical protein
MSDLLSDKLSMQEKIYLIKTQEPYIPVVTISKCYIHYIKHKWCIKYCAYNADDMPVNDSLVILKSNIHETLHLLVFSKNKLND